MVATAPHLIMTYCALLALAVLRDDYLLLDRAALKRMVGACQDADGGCVFLPFFYYHYGRLGRNIWSIRFETIPGAGDADLRMTYCAFVVCALLGDWSCIDLPRALSYIQRCRVRVHLFFPVLLPYALYAYNNDNINPRRTKADTGKRHWASRSADRRIALSRRCTSSRPTTHVRRRRVCSAPSGARRCAGYCTCRRRRWIPSAGAVSRDARISWQMRVTGSGAELLLPYVPLSRGMCACMIPH